MDEEDYRIRVKTRRQLDSVSARCLSALHGALDSCSTLSDEQRLSVKALDTAFENDLHENVIVNGKLWQEESDDEAEKTDDIFHLLTDEILELASKRKRYPKLILRHFVNEMDAARDAMKKSQPVFSPNIPESVNSADDEQHLTLKKRLPKIDKDAMDTLENAASTSDKVKEMSAAMTVFKAMMSNPLECEIFGGHTNETPPAPPKPARNPSFPLVSEIGQSGWNSSYG
uniref:kinetochore-associated protein NSL1 homolog n=1 Tax=Myxine glutinosa TaxID=7769 RepID=UPI00358E8681